MSGKVTADRMRALHEMFDEAKRQALSDRKREAIAMIALRAIIEGREVALVTREHHLKFGSASWRRREIEAWFNGLGFDIVVPMPVVLGQRVPEDEFSRRQSAEQALFYRPATSEVSYEALMMAVGLMDDKTVKDEGMRAKIGWEPAVQGYWFWGDVSARCPGLGYRVCSDRPLIRLPSLEEYPIVYYAHKALTGEQIDYHTSCWLRTPYDGQCAPVLSAHGYAGRVSVFRDQTVHVAFPDHLVGGRDTEQLVAA